MRVNDSNTLFAIPTGNRFTNDNYRCRGLSTATHVSCSTGSRTVTFFLLFSFLFFISRDEINADANIIGDGPVIANITYYAVGLTLKVPSPDRDDRAMITIGRATNRKNNSSARVNRTDIMTYYHYACKVIHKVQTIRIRCRANVKRYPPPTARTRSSTVWIVIIIIIVHLTRRPQSDFKRDGYIFTQSEINAVQMVWYPTESVRPARRFLVHVIRMRRLPPWHRVIVVVARCARPKRY